MHPRPDGANPAGPERSPSHVRPNPVRSIRVAPLPDLAGRSIAVGVGHACDRHPLLHEAAGVRAEEEINEFRSGIGLDAEIPVATAEIMIRRGAVEGAGWRLQHDPRALPAGPVVRGARGADPGRGVSAEQATKNNDETSTGSSRWFFEPIHFLRDRNEYIPYAGQNPFDRESNVPRILSAIWPIHVQRFSNALPIQVE